MTHPVCPFLTRISRNVHNTRLHSKTLETIDEISFMGSKYNKRSTLTIATLHEIHIRNGRAVTECDCILCRLLSVSTVPYITYGIDTISLIFKNDPSPDPMVKRLTTKWKETLISMGPCCNHTAWFMFSGLQEVGGLLNLRLYLVPTQWIENMARLSAVILCLFQINSLCR